MAVTKKKADCFIDCQNIFKGARELYGHNVPNFDVVKMCEKVAEKKGWEVGNIHFYTGVPSAEHAYFWNSYWNNRLPDLEKEGVKIFAPPLRYQRNRYFDEQGIEHVYMRGHEKGVDVKIALDMLKSAMSGCGAQILFSRDNDLKIAVDESMEMAAERGVKMDIISAFPSDGFHYGIRDVKAFHMTADFYDAIIDHRNYSPSKSYDPVTERSPSHHRNQRAGDNDELISNANKASEFIRTNRTRYNGP